MARKEKINILIVDDKPTNLYALEQMLIKPGRNIISATSGREALSTVLNNEISLIILDVQMPEMDGFEIAQILKSNKRTSDIPIIFASAEKKDHHFVMKGFGEGALDYLQKPLDKEITEAKVSVLLKLHLQRKELVEKNASLEKYALLINNSADIICIINAKTLKFEESNNAFYSLMGYDAEEVKGSSLLFYLTEDFRDKIEKLARDMREHFSFETQVYTKKHALRWLHWKIVNKNGLWFSNARDITETKEVEEIKNYLTAVVKQSNDAIYLLNPHGDIISWNNGAESIYEFSEREALNMNILNIVPDFLINEAQDVITNVMNGYEVQSLETKRISKSGKIIEVLFSATVITDTDNVLKSIAITEKDITEQKKSQLEISELNANLKKNVAQLEVINEELESFSYSISHDLRAPLRAINGYAQIILEEYQAGFDGELKRLFGVIQKNANRMGLLIDDLLSFSKLGRKELVKVSIDTNDMVKQIIREMQESVDGKTVINVKTLLPADGDYTLVYQAFVNLISNAIKYSSKKDKPEIEINSFESGEEHIYYVKDNGSGFNMDYADKLFGVFQRLHGDNEFEGTGVGLAIVKRVILKHRGRVWAESEVNKGATFYFSLPKPSIN
jgi:PAS domain S-box-containing protein